MHSQRLLVFLKKYKYSVRREQWRPKVTMTLTFWHTKILVDATDWTVNTTGDLDAAQSRGKITLNQSILVLKGKKREEKEYSEGLRLSFVGY